MELECVKYKEIMAASEARCNHPGDYCKFRSSCIIHFMEKENAAGMEPENGDTVASAHKEQQKLNHG